MRSVYFLGGYKMANTLDFNKVKKNYLTITLNNEEQTKLLVMTPTKRLLSELSNNLPDMSGGMPSEEDLRALYEFSAQLMSRNKTGRRVTAEELEQILDFEDLIIFFNAYTDFILTTVNEKN